MTLAQRPPPAPKTEQRRAADPAASVWVGASAGTGKTRVLTERVLRLLLGGTPPEKILCITFTRAAAAEMAERIGATLRRWAVMGEADLQRALFDLAGVRPTRADERQARRLFARVLDTPGGMKIMTIHAFCQSLLRRFPLEAGLPPHFELMEERQAVELLAGVRDRLFRDPDPDLAAAIGEVTAKANEEAFAGLMAELARERGRLARLLEAHGGIAGLAKRIDGAFGLAAGESEASIVMQACRDEAFDGAGLARAAEALLTGSKTDRERGDRIAAWLADPAGRGGGFAAYAAAFLTRNGKGDGIQRLMTKALALENPDALAALQAEQLRVAQVVERRRAAIVARSTEALMAIGEAIVAGYQAEKRRRSLIDYDDLVLAAVDLLERTGAAPWVLYKLDGGIDHILVDEAQDTNPDQWRVISALTAEFFAGLGAREQPRTVFAVGDEKQSIFSFQRADPAEFARMRGHFAHAAEAAAKPWARVGLDVSFRSTAPVLQFVDAVFADERARDGLFLEAARPLRHGVQRIGQGGLVELWPLVTADGPEPAGPWSLPTEQGRRDNPAAELARRIAATVRGWLDGGEMLESRGRPIRPGDILVLVRTRNAFFAELVRALKEAGVPVAGMDRMKLVEQLAVMDLLALAEFLLLPEDDLSLATVLKSPLIGLSEDALFDLAHARQGSLWRALRRDAEDEGAAEGGAAAGAAAWLAGLLDRVDFERPFELFAHVLAAPCPADAQSGRRAMLGRLGGEAEDPLDELLSLALAFEARHVPSLQGFLHWIRAGEIEVKREMESADSRVRIMTVHGAKGLEAPVVFLPDTTRLPKPVQGGTLLWPDAPDGIPVWVPPRDDEDERSRAVRQAYERRVAQEYARLLYVALTRARDRLYVCGYAGERAVPEDCWYRFCQAAVQRLDGVETEPAGWPAGPEEDPALLARFRAVQTVPPEEEERAPSPAAVEPLPDWVLADPPREPEPPRPLSPSRPEEADPPVRSPLGPDDGSRYRRGRLVHALLQRLPEAPPEDRAEAARRYLARPVHGLAPEEAAEIAAETLAVLETPEFAPLFGPDSRAEVPLAGLVAGRPMAGQVDRLVVEESRVLVVDYKTSRPPPVRESDVHPAYVRQMALYRGALRGVFPGRTVVCALLWTDGPVLMALSDRLLDRWAPRPASEA
jgi:ATP-dependent helicase/nuclease subunit A